MLTLWLASDHVRWLEKCVSTRGIELLSRLTLQKKSRFGINEKVPSAVRVPSALRTEGEGVVENSQTIAARADSTKCASHAVSTCVLLVQAEIKCKPHDDMKPA